MLDSHSRWMRLVACLVVAIAAVVLSGARISAAPSRGMPSASPTKLVDKYTKKDCKTDGGTVSASGTGCILKSGYVIYFNYTTANCKTDGGSINETSAGKLCVLKSGYSIKVDD
jgi:hypothetical protein